MIAYEELEKALQRWKTRRATVAAAVAEVPPEISEHGIPTGISGDETSASDSTGELEIGDANVVDES
ncbi:MAG TPA: hypothetical protein VGP07_10940 [Polyangia bacterium]|jgi:hypothetical protein